MPLRLRLESIVGSVEEAEGLIDGESELVVLQFNLALASSHSGAFRLLIPGGALRHAEPSPGSSARHQRWLGLLEEHGTRLGGARSHLWFEIGHCDLDTGRPEVTPRGRRRASR